jgi:hypothetical protein
MKRFIPILLIAAGLATGCTSVTAPNGWSYKSGLFQKQIGELEVTGGTNGTYSLRMKGYQSEAQNLVGAVAEGVAKGLKP